MGFKSISVTTFEFLCVLAALGLFASAKAYQPVMTAGIILLAIAALVRWAYRGRLFQPTRLDWPLGLFLLSGAAGLWASYDLPTSLARFCLILGGVALYYTLSQASLPVRLAAAAGLVLFAAGLALYFVTQHNELAEAGAGKFPWLGALGAALRGHAPQLNLYQPHPNVVAGVLGVGAIVGLAWLAILHREGSGSWARRLLLPISAVALALIVFGLLLTGARGAWLAAGLAGLGWALTDMRRTARLRALDALALAVILGSALLLLLLGFRGPGELPLAERLASRLALYRGTAQLIRDYLFTGAGLGAFPLLYSAYVLGIDVVSQTHPHNLYLSVWLEQGLLGVVALLWLGYAFFRAYWGLRGKQAPVSPPGPPPFDKAQDWQGGVLVIPPSGGVGQAPAPRLLATACFWAVAVIFVHGLIDSVPYSSRFLPIIFIPLALGGFLARPAVAGPETGVLRPGASIVFRRNVALGTLAGVVLFGLLLWGRNPALAAWYANLGALAQARIELSDYHWPDRIPSQVRATADLSRPTLLFERALALAPGNSTARERLELIRLGISGQ